MTSDQQHPQPKPDLSSVAETFAARLFVIEEHLRSIRTAAWWIASLMIAASALALLFGFMEAVDAAAQERETESIRRIQEYLRQRSN